METENEVLSLLGVLFLLCLLSGSCLSSRTERRNHFIPCVWAWRNSGLCLAQQGDGGSFCKDAPENSHDLAHVGHLWLSPKCVVLGKVSHPIRNKSGKSVGMERALIEGPQESIKGPAKIRNQELEEMPVYLLVWYFFSKKFQHPRCWIEKKVGSVVLFLKSC